MNQSKLKAGVEFLNQKFKEMGIRVPSVHLVLGSGFASALETAVSQEIWEAKGGFPFAELPGLPSTTVQGHSGQFKFFQNRRTGQSVSVQVGRLHGYEGHSPQQVVYPVMAFRLAGTPQFFLTNAAGSLLEKQGMGSVMLLEDHFNLTGNNPLLGPNPTNPMDPHGGTIGPRFPDMSEVYDRSVRESLKKHLKDTGLAVHEGVYLGLMGPTYETPAEVRIFAKWGAHAVGMSTVWEAIALRHSGAKIAGMSLISNLACGIGGLKELSHQEILDECGHAAGKILKGVFSHLEQAS